MYWSPVHNGYIGSVVVPVLARAGHAVVGVDSDLFAACTFGGDVSEIAGRRMDVRDIEREDLVGFDAVIHLAAGGSDGSDHGGRRDHHHRQREHLKEEDRVRPG